MANKQVLMNEIETLPANCIDEILHYVLSLKKLNSNTISNITLASEHALAKEWLSPEEEEAWRDL